MASHDGMALAALRVLHEQGLRVPHDIRVTGFDDIPGTAQWVPSLTTIRQPIASMATQAFEVLRGKETGDILRLPPELIIRESTGS